MTGNSILLKTQKLTKVFHTEAGPLEVLKGIDLQIYEGEVLAIVGASGAGKSTLLHIIGTIDRPTSGEVFFRDRDIFKLNDKELAVFRNKTIGFVFQFHHLLPEFNALENVMMPALVAGWSKERARDRALQLLQALGVEQRASHRPAELSGGEQQRVAVARALMMNPQIVLADEPTGNLDTATGRNLFSLIKTLNRQLGITFVIVTHNPEIARGCDRTLIMTDGRLKSD